MDRTKREQRSREQNVNTQKSSDIMAQVLCLDMAPDLWQRVG